MDVHERARQGLIPFSYQRPSEEERAGRKARAVERGEGLERVLVGGGGVAEDDGLGGHGGAPFGCIHMVPRSTYNVKERSRMTSIRARDTVCVVLDLRLLETFREVAARGSFSAAGALIYIVKQMTDGKLVARDPGRVEATQAEQIARHQVLLTESLERERKWETFALSRLTKDQP